MGRLTEEELAVFVTVSCDRQGVPVKVTDVRVLADVATLLRGDGELLKLGSPRNGVGDDETEE